jgi:hypothetical protein
MNETVKSLWVGPHPISDMERLTMLSHLAQGHEFHLFSYESHQLPRGVIVRSATEYFPEENVFSYHRGPGRGSFSAFSNLFRYSMLYREGGTWVDMDMVAIRPFHELEGEYLFASEECAGDVLVGSCVIRCPKESDFMASCIEEATRRGQDIRWGQVGPGLVARQISLMKMERFMVQPEVFCPVNYLNEQFSLLTNDVHGDWKTPETRGVHLWHEIWRRRRQAKNKTYHPNSIYEQLKREYL